MSEDIVELEKIDEGVWKIKNHDQKRPLSKIRFEKDEQIDDDFKLKKISEGVYTLEGFGPKKSLAKYK